MIWAGIVVITFAIAVRIYPIFIFLLKERIKPLVEALYDKLPWIWETYPFMIEIDFCCIICFLRHSFLWLSENNLDL
ncbi:hypothetical protein ACJX0J_040892, partial [Zea mays]